MEELERARDMMNAGATGCGITRCDSLCLACGWLGKFTCSLSRALQMAPPGLWWPGSSNESPPGFWLHIASFSSPLVAVQSRLALGLEAVSHTAVLGSRLSPWLL